MVAVTATGTAEATGAEEVVRLDAVGTGDVEGRGLLAPPTELGEETTGRVPPPTDAWAACLRVASGRAAATRLSVTPCAWAAPSPGIRFATPGPPRWGHSRTCSTNV